MSLILISIFLILTTSTILAVYNYIEICKLKIEHQREYEHLLNNIKNIEFFLKNENEK
jgi:hypothetical protein